MSTTLLQPYQLLGALYAGFVIGVLYSVFGIFRYLLRKFRWCIYALDALFLLCVMVVVELALILFCDGELWFFMLLGISAGGLIYGMTEHRLLKRIAIKLTVPHGTKRKKE